MALSNPNQTPINPPEPPPPLLSVRHLSVRYPRRSPILQRITGWLPAVDDVSFDLAKGESLGLVGESGSGKSTVGRAILRLVDAAAGQILLGGQDLRLAQGHTLRRLRRRMQMVFQDPAGSLNPRMTIGDIVAEPLLVHHAAEPDLPRQVAALLERCGMPADAAPRYPHQFSGGQRQRIAIARAIALHPDLLICDEPTSALDVSIQAQILNLLADLQREQGLSYLFISHDMAVVQHMCPRIAVMRAGKIVEYGPRDTILTSPTQDYTKRLLAAVPGARANAEG